MESRVIDLVDAEVFFWENVNRFIQEGNPLSGLTRAYLEKIGARGNMEVAEKVCVFFRGALMTLS